MTDSQPCPFDRPTLDDTCISSCVDVMAAVTRSKRPRPWLVIVSGSAGVGKMFPLEGEIVVGRSPGARILLEEDGVSRQHAKLVCSLEGEVEIVDLASRNGTFVNGERVTHRTLRDGDKVQIATTTILKLSYLDELDEALSRNLYSSATRDALTGLTNRRSFDETLTKELAFARRHRRELSLLVLDVDHFKRINDGLGHPCGDHVLQTLAARLRASVRTEDEVARIGGEELAVILRDIDARGAHDCAERVRRAIETPFFAWQDELVPVTVSVGISTFDRTLHMTPNMMVSDADEQLYRAKTSGRNRVCARQTTPSSGVADEQRPSAATNASIFRAAT